MGIYWVFTWWYLPDGIYLVERTVAVRSTWLSNRLSTPFGNRMDNRLDVCLQFFYTIQSVVKPVVQPFWQPVVSCKRGINFSRGMQCIVMLSAANLTTLASRKEEMSRKFFLYISQPTSCLHQLLPDPRDHSVISRLSTYEIYPPLVCSLTLNITAPSFTMH